MSPLTSRIETIKMTEVFRLTQTSPKLSRVHVPRRALGLGDVFNNNIGLALSGSRLTGAAVVLDESLQESKAGCCGKRCSWEETVRPRSCGEGIGVDVLWRRFYCCIYTGSLYTQYITLLERGQRRWIQKGKGKNKFAPGVEGRGRESRKSRWRRWHPFFFVY